MGFLSRSINMQVSAVRRLASAQTMGPTTIRTMIHAANKAPIPARVKLQEVLEEYREKNYGQTLFSRFVKEMLVATDVDHDGKISPTELMRLLRNIGAAGQLTSQDVEDVVNEYGVLDEATQEKLMDVAEIQELILGARQRPNAA